MVLRSICLLTTSYPTTANFKPDAPNGKHTRGKFVHDMAKALVAGGFRVFVVTDRVPGEPRESVIDGVHVRRFSYFIPGFETLTEGAGIPENIKKLKNKIQVPFYFLSLLLTSWKLIKEEKIDYINAHWVVPNGFLGWILKRITGQPLIITAYGAELFPVLQGRMKFTIPFIQRAVAGADLVAGISATTVEALKKISGRSDIHVIPDGIDTTYYSPGPGDEAVRDKYDLRGKRVVFFTGRMVTRKGHRYLLEAMKEVTRRFPDVVCLLGGGGPKFEELLKLRGVWGLEASVRMPGFIPEHEMVSLFRMATIFVLPSCVDETGDTEGSATAAFEAMACGTISLVSQVGGNLGSIEAGRGADYFNPADSFDLAAKLTSVLSMSQERDKEWRIKARKYVITRYEWDVVVKRYLGHLGIHSETFTANKLEATL